jgi:hypothetical protein
VCVWDHPAILPSLCAEAEDGDTPAMTEHAVAVLTRDHSTLVEVVRVVIPQLHRSHSIPIDETNQLGAADIGRFQK